MSESNSPKRLCHAPRRSVCAPANFFARYALTCSALAAMVALALQSAPAVAQEQARTQSVEIFGGELFGDKLTDAPVSGRNPRLNDDALAGLRYNYNLTDMWGVQLSSGYSWSRASRVQFGDNKLGLTTVALDAVWNITPRLSSPSLPTRLPVPVTPGPI